MEIKILFNKMKFYLNSSIDEKYKKEFDEEHYNDIHFKYGVFTKVLAGLGLFFFLLTIFLFQNSWYFFPRAWYSILYIGIVIVSLIYAVFLKNIPKNAEMNFFQKFFLVLLTAIVSLWCVALTFVDQLYSQQISAYIIGILAIAVTVQYKLWVSIIVYITTFITLILFLPIFMTNRDILVSHNINAFSTTMIGIVLSNIIYCSKIRGFIDKKTIINQSKEIDLAHSKIIISERLSALARLAGGVAHELNSPLGAALTSIDLLKNEIEETVELKDKAELLTSAEIAEDGIKKASKIVKQLLRFTNNKESFGTEKFSIGEIITFITEALVSSLKEKSIDLEIQIINDFEFYGNSIEIVQVFENVIQNAKEAIIKKNIKNGLISIILENRECKISDNGVGIDEDIKDKIFDPFFSTKIIGEGLGLGLSTSFETMKKYGGSIEIESKKNEGCSVIIIF